MQATWNEMIREARFLVRRFREYEWPRVVPSTLPDVDAEALEGLVM